MMGCRLSRFMLWGIMVIIGIGVTMGVLFPAGRDPFVPKASAVAMNGRNLYYMIALNSAQHDIAGKWINPQKCSNSVEYITGVLGVGEASGQELCCTDAESLLWNVAIDVHDSYDELFPMLISANFNPRLLESAIDDDTQLPIGLASGASLSLLDDKAIILVRKNGSSQVIKAKYCTKKNIFKIPCKSSGSVMYLTPEGKITINLTQGRRLQGAGRAGGLLDLTIDGTIYIPCYDNIGNITRYLDANGNTGAQYNYGGVYPNAK